MAARAESAEPCNGSSPHLSKNREPVGNVSKRERGKRSGESGEMRSARKPAARTRKEL